MEILHNKKPQTLKALNNRHLFIPHQSAQSLVARLAFSPAVEWWSHSADYGWLPHTPGRNSCWLEGLGWKIWFYFMCLSTTSRLAWLCAELVARQEQWQTIACSFFSSPECTNMTNILLRKAKLRSWIQNQGVGKYMPFFFLTEDMQNHMAMNVNGEVKTGGINSVNLLKLLFDF